FHVLFINIVNNLLDLIAIRIGNKDPAMTAINIRKALTCLPHSRGVNNRHYLAKVIFNQVIKQGFIGILNITQINMLIDITIKSTILLVRALTLFLDGLGHMRN